MHFKYKIGVIGAGNMGEVLIRGLLSSKLIKAGELIASNRGQKKLTACRRKYKIAVTPSNKEVLQKSRCILLGVKPQDIDSLFPELRRFLTKKHLVISIVTGVDTQKLNRAFGNRYPLVRVSPNLPSQIGAGSAGIYCTRFVSAQQKRFAHQIFEAVGTTVDVPKEAWLDIITGLSGTGPAYVFALMEGLIEGGKKMGLPSAVAKKLTLETVLGAAKMAMQTRFSPEELRAKVTSKKGTTWAAMKVFRKRGFWNTLIQAVTAATKRAKELRGK